jgi:exonuclease SbcC
LFEFSIGDRVYTVARRVDRTAGGASVSEARLQEGEKTLESGSKEVTAAVSDLLGLEFEHFTKAVVLPQGAFADFLTDTPRERQDLLRALLDLGLFERIKVAANERAASAKGSLQTLEENLAKLEVPGPEEVESAVERLSELESALAELPARMSAQNTLESRLAEQGAELESLRARIERLESNAPPEGHETVLEGLAEAKAAAEAAQGRVTGIEAQLAALGEARGSLPSADDLRRWGEAVVGLKQLSEQREGLFLDSLASAVAEGEEALGAVRRQHEALRDSHAAHEIRGHLAPGDVCPVCGHEVDSLPATDGPTDDAMREVSVRVEKAEKELQDRVAALATASGQEKQLTVRIEELEKELVSAPDTERLTEIVEQIARIDEDRVKVTEELAGAVAERERAVEMATGLADAGERLRNGLIEARTDLRAENPPETGPGDSGGWREFDEWRQGRTERLAGERVGAEAKIAALQGDLDAALTESRAWLESLDIHIETTAETDLALACERQRNEVTGIRETVESAKGLESQLKEETARLAVAAALGQHLKSNNFEAWVMVEALQSLVDGANGLLDDLSAGAYSLEVDKSGFGVVDHRNADLRRTTRSLSGGEVFLVSLSLALSMASQLAGLTGSASRLESVFLDEGFGTLDAESLDTVAAVLDQLVVEGRTVGIVTHVKELAERIPVRFEVVKGPHTSSIRRRET